MLDLTTKTYKRSESVVFLKVKETWGEFSNTATWPINVFPSIIVAEVTPPTK